MEQKENKIRFPLMEVQVFRGIVEEAAVLTSVTLFLGIIAIWAQLIIATF